MMDRNTHVCSQIRMQWANLWRPACCNTTLLQGEHFRPSRLRTSPRKPIIWSQSPSMARRWTLPSVATNSMATPVSMIRTLAARNTKPSMIGCGPLSPFARPANHSDASRPLPHELAGRTLVGIGIPVMSILVKCFAPSLSTRWMTWVPTAFGLQLSDEIHNSLSLHLRRWTQLLRFVGHEWMP